MRERKKLIFRNERFMDEEVMKAINTLSRSKTKNRMRRMTEDDLFTTETSFSRVARRPNKTEKFRKQKEHGAKKRIKP